MQVVDTVTALRTAMAPLKNMGSVGLIPTMGALHAGHISLVKYALSRCSHVAASIFVNPKQFGPNEDYDRYPRMREADLAKLNAAGTSIAFVPDVREMYPNGFTTVISVGELGSILCGAYRPGHFDGVATVVAKLLLQSQADSAFFGEKDYQQLTIIRRMTLDLNIPTVIIGVPTVRETDGLALSSRNAYFNTDERAAAPALYRALNTVKDAFHKGEDVEAAIGRAKESILKAGFSSIDYIEVRNALTLSTEVTRGNARVLGAARIGNTRLIDNIPA